MEDSRDRVVVGTRFSRLTAPPSSPLTPAELRLEALCALAEGLDLLAASLRRLHGGPPCDPRRLQHHSVRVARLCDAAAAPSSNQE
jgi:hypothetical protein